jgi:hypothetical protein
MKKAEGKLLTGKEFRLTKEWLNIVSRQLGIGRRLLESNDRLRRRIERALEKIQV